MQLFFWSDVDSCTPVATLSMDMFVDTFFLVRNRYLLPGAGGVVRGPSGERRGWKAEAEAGEGGVVREMNRQGVQRQNDGHVTERGSIAQ